MRRQSHARQRSEARRPASRMLWRPCCCPAHADQFARTTISPSMPCSSASFDGEKFVSLGEVIPPRRRQEVDMRGLIMETPLLDIVHHRACRRHARRDGNRVAHHRRRAASLHLRRCRGRGPSVLQGAVALGVQSGDRVGSLAWNNAHHFELFYSVSGIGCGAAHDHPRLFEEQIAFIVIMPRIAGSCFDRRDPAGRPAYRPPSDDGRRLDLPR